jgi:hypothetical protein
MERSKEERINFLRYLIAKDFGDHQAFYLSLSPDEKESIEHMVLDYENEEELKSREMKVGGDWFPLWQLRRLRGACDSSPAAYSAITYMAGRVISLSENLSKYSTEELKSNLVDISRCMEFLAGDL